MFSENYYVLGVDLSYKATNAAVTRNKSSTNAKLTQKESAKVNFNSSISLWVEPASMEELIS